MYTHTQTHNLKNYQHIFMEDTHQTQMTNILHRLEMFFRVELIEKYLLVMETYTFNDDPTTYKNFFWCQWSPWSSRDCVCGPFRWIKLYDRIYYSLELTLLPPYTGSLIGSPPSVCGGYTVVSGDPALCPLIGSLMVNSEEWRQERGIRLLVSLCWRSCSH